MPNPTSEKKRLRKWKAGVLAVAFATTSAGGFVTGKYYGGQQAQTAIAVHNQQIQDQKRFIEHLTKEAGEKLLIQDVLEELRYHPPADEEIERHLMAYAASEGEKVMSLAPKSCCKSEYEAVLKEFDTHKLMHDKDAGLRLLAGIIWLEERCSVKIH